MRPNRWRSTATTRTVRLPGRDEYRPPLFRPRTIADRTPALRLRHPTYNADRACNVGPRANVGSGDPRRPHTRCMTGTDDTESLSLGGTTGHSDIAEDEPAEVGASAWRSQLLRRAQRLEDELDRL
jgi:hypothetical protein